MKDFVYVTKKEAAPARADLEELIHLVQDELRKTFTFSYEFIGSASRNMITYDRKSNVGYDFDVNIRINDEENNFTAKEIKTKLMNAFNKYSKRFQYDNAEDGKRVITIKVKGRKNSKILHSCDFAVVNDYQDQDGDWHQEYIHFNKSDNTYQWNEQPAGFYELPEKIDWIKENGLWQKVRDLYIKKKNVNNDPNKKSRSVFAETISNIYNDN